MRTWAQSSPLRRDWRALCVVQETAPMCRSTAGRHRTHRPCSPHHQQHAPPLKGTAFHRRAAAHFDSATQNEPGMTGRKRRARGAGRALGVKPERRGGSCELRGRGCTRRGRSGFAERSCPLLERRALWEGSGQRRGEAPRARPRVSCGASGTRPWGSAPKRAARAKPGTRPFPNCTGRSPAPEI